MAVIDSLFMVLNGDGKNMFHFLLNRRGRLVNLFLVLLSLRASSLCFSDVFGYIIFLNIQL